MKKNFQAPALDFVLDHVNTQEEQEQMQEKKQEKESKTALYIKIDKLSSDYLDFISSITKEGKKDIINKLILADLKDRLDLPKNATEEEMFKALENKTKEIQKLLK